MSSGVGQGHRALPAEARFPQEREVHTWREGEEGGRGERKERREGEEGGREREEGGGGK